VLHACKCCGAATAPFGRVEAARSCEDRHAAPVFAPGGRQNAYRRCLAHGFVATGDFDALSDADMANTIHNADYIRAQEAMYKASLRGAGELWRTARQVARSGAFEVALAPRHAARAFLRRHGAS
jgi:hypothetical protein